MKRLAALAFVLLAPLFASAQSNSYTAYAPGSAPSYEGLWWNASQSGWGLSLAHQGDMLFVVWYTFDRDGMPTWFLMPDARLSNEDNMMSGMGDVEMMMGMPRNSPTYTGGLYRPSMSLGKLVVTQVGMGTVIFKDKDHAVFGYTVGSFSGSSQVSRMVYDAGAPTCNIGGSKGATENYQDLWYDPTDAGWGVNIVHQGNTIFGTFYSYDDAGRPTWYAMPDTRKTAPLGQAVATYAGQIVRATGPSYEGTWDSSKVDIGVVGEATFTFDSRGNGGLWTRVDGAVRPARPILRMQFAAPATVCR